MKSKATPSKIVLLKTGWCDDYRGDPVQGNFSYLRERGEASGHEKFNFLADHGVYRGYCPPHCPKPESPDGWTVIWVAKRPGTQGVRVVGAYYDAHFLGEYRTREVSGESIYHCVTAKRMLFVPPERRTRAFRVPISGGSHCYLRKPGRLSKYASITTKLLAFIAAADRDLAAEPAQPTNTFGIPNTEQRRAIENAAMDYVERYYLRQRYKTRRRHRENLGFDIEAQRGNSTLHLEIKGTARTEPFAYLTANELRRAMQDPEGAWLLCVVTNALTQPNLLVYTYRELKAAFLLDAIAYRATLK